jgi:hypothetical protein
VKVGDVDGELQKLLVWRRKLLRGGHLIVETWVEGRLSARDHLPSELSYVRSG